MAESDTSDDLTLAVSFGEIVAHFTRHCGKPMHPRAWPKFNEVFGKTIVPAVRERRRRWQGQGRLFVLDRVEEIAKCAEKLADTGDFITTPVLAEAADRVIAYYKVVCARDRRRGDFCFGYRVAGREDRDPCWD